jgi:hypothetical protein
MPQPPAYSRSSNLAGYATANPAAPYPPAQVDAEFNNIVATLAQALENLSLLQRDDGAPRNSSIPAEAFGPTALALIGSAGFTIADPVGWLTATAYPARQIVTQAGATYVSVSAHTSGVFNTDLAAGKWVLLFSAVSVAASAVTFTPTGTVAAMNTQSAIAEVASEAMQKSANLSDVSSYALSLFNLLSGTGRRLQSDFTNPTVTDRTMFQTSTPNGITSVGILPNGTATQAGIAMEGNAFATGFLGLLHINTTALELTSTVRVPGTPVPINITAGNGLMTIEPTLGNVTIGSGPNVAGVRSFTLVNGDTSAAAYAQMQTQSDGGILTVRAASIAAGAFGLIESAFNNGLFVNSLVGGIAFQTAGTEHLRIRNDGTIWTDNNARPVFQCRAWARVNGVTPSITAGGNFASVTDLGSAQLRLAFSTAMPDANYSVAFSVRIPSASNNAAVVLLDTGDYTTTHFDIKTHGSTNLAVLAADIIGVQVFR